MTIWAPFGVKVGSIMCPRCGAWAGNWCTNLKQQEMFTRPHRERTEAYRFEQQRSTPK